MTRTLFTRIYNFFNFVQIFEDFSKNKENSANFFAFKMKSRGNKEPRGLKVAGLKVAGIYCHAKFKNKKSWVLKVAKSRNIFAQLIPATFSTRDF